MDSGLWPAITRAARGPPCSPLPALRLVAFGKRRGGRALAPRRVARPEAGLVPVARIVEGRLAHADFLGLLKTLALGLDRGGEHRSRLLEVVDRLVAAGGHRPAGARPSGSAFPSFSRGGPMMISSRLATCWVCTRAPARVSETKTAPVFPAPPSRAQAVSRPSTASAPHATAFAIWPPVHMPPSAITFTYFPVSSRCWTRAAAASRWRSPAARPRRGLRASCTRGLADADEHALGSVRIRCSAVW